MKNEHSSSRADNYCSRRKFIAGAAGLLPVALAGKALCANKKGTSALPPPKYTLAVRMSANFARQHKSMPVDKRFTLAASLGAKAYQIGTFSDLDLDEYRRNADKHGMRCASLAGTGRVGLSTGLTVTGKEKDYLDFFTTAVNAAKVLGAQNLVSFVGERSDTIPWETQYKQIISGLRKAGDIAGEAGVYLTLEPLNQYWKPKMTVQSAQAGFKILREVDHPHVKLDFDIYHLQQSEGNLTRNLREGMAEGLIQLVEVGSVPGRLEPGTGEVNYEHIFNELRRLEYDGFIGMEHFTKTSFTSAFKQVQRLAGVE
mgnify:CR=1 FL=1